MSTPFRNRATAEIQAAFKTSVVSLGRQHPGKPVVVMVRRSDRVGDEAELTVREMGLLAS